MYIFMCVCVFKMPCLSDGLNPESIITLNVHLPHEDGDKVCLRAAAKKKPSMTTGARTVATKAVVIHFAPEAVAQEYPTGAQAVTRMACFPMLDAGSWAEASETSNRANKCIAA